MFYSFYDAPQKQRYTGLFFFRGKKGAPFALICPGGGFAYIGSLHEGFPLAEELSRMGYNAFVLQYRTGGEAVACEDMAAAVSWIFAQADTLGVSTKNYSVWGGSAGARMAANLGLLWRVGLRRAKCFTSYGCRHGLHRTQPLYKRRSSNICRSQLRRSHCQSACHEAQDKLPQTCRNQCGISSLSPRGTWIRNRNRYGCRGMDGESRPFLGTDSTVKSKEKRL